MNTKDGASKESEKWIEFEHYQYVARGGGEDRDPEIHDVCYRYRAKVVNPEPEKVLEGKVHSWCYEDDGQYAILDTREGYWAVRMDLHVPQGRAHNYQFRSVILDEPGQPLDWEVHRQEGSGFWTPVEGQHLRPRTADGALWLQEIGQASDDLKERHRELCQAQRKLMEVSGQRAGTTSPAPGKSVQIGLPDLETTSQLKAINHALATVNREIAGADELMRHMQRLEGVPVTLWESAILGRNQVPILQPRQTSSIGLSNSQKMCV